MRHSLFIPENPVWFMKTLVDEFWVSKIIKNVHVFSIVILYLSKFCRIRPIPWISDSTNDSSSFIANTANNRIPRCEISSERLLRTYRKIQKWRYWVVKIRGTTYFSWSESLASDSFYILRYGYFRYYISLFRFWYALHFFSWALLNFFWRSNMNLYGISINI